ARAARRRPPDSRDCTLAKPAAHLRDWTLFHSQNHSQSPRGRSSRATQMSYVPTLKKVYTEQVVPELVKTRGYKNKHEVPKLVKISINSGIDAEADKNQIADCARDIALIAGQKPILARTRRAIANFK